jgi:hypothetical protein
MPKLKVKSQIPFQIEFDEKVKREKKGSLHFFPNTIVDVTDNEFSFLTKDKNVSANFEVVVEHKPLKKKIIQESVNDSSAIFSSKKKKKYDEFATTEKDPQTV